MENDPTDKDKSEKYRPAAKSKSNDDFLDTLNFDLKESNVQARIKSELQKEVAEPSSNQEEKAPSPEIDNLFDDALGESMEDFLSDFDDVIVVEKEGGKPVISGPLIDILKEQRYIQGELSTEEELQKVPEYQVLRTIIKEHPIALTLLEEKTTVESLSLVLSNLQADNLILYTNDYEWTISDKVRENLLEFISQTKDSGEMERLRGLVLKNTTYERQLILAMYKLNYIPSYDMGMIEMMQIPEFGLMRAVKDNEPADLDIIQKSLDRSLDLPPVHLSRILTQLESDNLVKSSGDTWELTDQFVKMLVGK